MVNLLQTLQMEIKKLKVVRVCSFEIKKNLLIRVDILQVYKLNQS